MVGHCGCGYTALRDQKKLTAADNTDERERQHSSGGADCRRQILNVAVLRLYVRVRGVSSMSVGVLDGFTQSIFKMEKTSLWEAAAEDIDKVLASE
jgi:hypothetical protein